MGKTTIVSKFFITTTLVLLGTNMFYLNKTKELKEENDNKVSILAAYYGSLIDDSMIISCYQTTENLCNVMVDCSEVPIEKLTNYCERMNK